ncbi:hypothetical protein [Arcticibacterium luteifluviistationis]|nr:hypothetical protein [Arcticibacterium luteifluviistationis]
MYTFHFDKEPILGSDQDSTLNRGPLKDLQVHKDVGIKSNASQGGMH